MIFLSALLRQNVVDNIGHRIGLLDDLYVTLKETFPVVTAIVLRTGVNTKVTLPWHQVKSLTVFPIQLTVDASHITSYLPGENEVLLGQDILDKQIVDRRGLRVVKINDLQIAQTRQAARLVGVDISLSGLLRRLGLLTTAQKLCSIFPLHLSERIITWDYVEPVQLIPAEEEVKTTANQQLVTDFAAASYSGVTHVKLNVSQDTLARVCIIDLAALAEKIDLEQRENYSDLDYALVL